MRHSLQSRPKPIRSFVIRSGRMTNGQESALEKYWPAYGLDLDHGLLHQELVFGRVAPLVLEIGFGMGDSLLDMCQKEPEKNFIGVEVHPPGVGRLMNEAALAGITNLRVYLADATDVLKECIASDSLDRLQIYFPDPWHKKRHHKRRLVQTDLINLCQSRLKIGGVLHLATDWLPYAEWMLEVISPIAGLENCSASGFSDKPDWRPETKFERRGNRLGHTVNDLLFRRVG